MSDSPLIARSAFSGLARSVGDGSGVVAADRDGLGLATVAALKGRAEALPQRVLERFLNLNVLPRRVENLLPACKNLGVTHLTNGCYRLHPVEWNIGESAGMLAAEALGLGTTMISAAAPVPTLRTGSPL